MQWIGYLACFALGVLAGALGRRLLSKKGGGGVKPPSPNVIDEIVRRAIAAHDAREKTDDIVSEIEKWLSEK